jgi:hypothetical protein
MGVERLGVVADTEAGLEIHGGWNIALDGAGVVSVFL